MEYRKKQRNLLPPVYSDRRLKEANLPPKLAVASSSSLNHVVSRIMSASSDANNLTSKMRTNEVLDQPSTVQICSSSTVESPTEAVASSEVKSPLNLVKIKMERNLRKHLYFAYLFPAIMPKISLRSIYISGSDVYYDYDTQQHGDVPISVDNGNPIKLEETVFVYGSAQSVANLLMEQLEQQTEHTDGRVDGGGNIESNATSFRDDASSDVSNDDCIMLGDTIPMPLNSTNDELIKRENDTISGNKPFNTSVCYFSWFYDRY